MLKIKLNNENNDLWCIYSKERIQVGEKYIEIEEDNVIKIYKIENVPVENNEEDLYVGE